MIYDARVWVTVWWLSFTAFWFWFFLYWGFWGLGLLVKFMKKSFRYR